MTEEFEILLNGKEFADEDAEGFDSFEMYQDFTERFTNLAIEELDIEIVDAEDGKVTILINEEELLLSYNPDDNWFDPAYIDQLNVHLKENKLTDNRFCFVEPYGLANADQGVKIAFIDKRLLEELIKKSYARESDNEAITYFN